MSFGVATKVLQFAIDYKAQRDLASLIKILRNEHAAVETRTATCHAAFSNSKNDHQVAWLKEGGRVFMDMSDRYAVKGRAGEFLESYGECFQALKPATDKAHVNFKNATFELSRTGSSAQRFKKVARSPKNNCYFGISVTLDYKPAASDEEEMR